MKKVIFSLMLMMSTVLGMSAQTVESSGLLDNTAVTVKGGASGLLHPGCNNYQNFGHTIQASAGVGLEKWITPAFGIGLEGTVGFGNGSKKYNGMFCNYYSKNWVNYLTVMTQAKVNVANLFLGYAGQPRKVEFIPTVGIGWVHGFYQGTEWGAPESGVYANDQNGIGTKYSVEVKWNVAPRLSVVASPYIAYRFTTDKAIANRQPRFDARNAWWGLEVGVSYRLGKNFKLCPYKYTQADMDAVNAKVNELQAELAKKPKTVEKVVKETVTKSVDANRYVVFFATSSSELSSEAKATLDKINASEVALVVGSASPDGSQALNEQLANDRATAVKDYLNAKGISVKQAKGVGTQLNSRVAVVTVSE